MFLNKKDNNLKYFIIAFSVFILLLLVFSSLIFLHYINYDFDNIVEKGSSTQLDDTLKTEDVKHTVSNVSGKSQVLFTILDDEKNVEMAFFVVTDFDKKSMQVEVVEDCVSLTTHYSENGESGLKDYVKEIYRINIDKYAVFSKNDFKTVLSAFDGVVVNVSEPVNYKSDDLNLILDAGQQVVSGDILYKYLLISDSQLRESIICDLINSVLQNNYVEKSDELFKKFVNLCATDISIIDYSNAMKIIEIYVNAEDRFLPKSYSNED